MAEREQLQQKQTSAGSYRFPPTASVATNYSHIVPNRNKRGTSVRALERALEKREEEEGEMYNTTCGPGPGGSRLYLQY